MEIQQIYCQIRNNDLDNIPVGVPTVWYPPRPLSPPLTAGGNIWIFASGSTLMFTSNMFQENWKPIKVRNNNKFLC